MGGPLKRTKQLRHGALLLGEDGAVESESPDGDFDEQLKVLRCVLAESRRSRDGVRSSSRSRAAHATSEDRAAQKRSGSLPLRGLSSRCPCTTVLVFRRRFQPAHP